MGVHEALPQPGGLLLNGLLPNDTGNVTRVLDAERWSKVEKRVAELILCIQPNRPSEERRNAVAKYVQELIMKCFSCEVFTFGSVPLKTYLPDGDIDLTAFSLSEDLKDTWANAVLKVLENEGKNGNGEFRVKEVHYIRAEVKIIKCLVENIVVDISFSQVGGLCTLCFLEEIDHLISQNHLFKRSIILIKAWCYYESRTLGAYHGLISTYALEILVLYIFNVFNNTFAGPFEVLYRFLEFFSNFDWDNFSVSIWGPVPISSLPVMTAELPRKDGGKLLFDKLFLEACSTVYAVSLGGQESQGQQFVSKYFNVIDPLRTNNNLGRSVNKGNFYRIRSAFAFGAKKIANLLDCPKENLIAEVDWFFMNTWERHRSGNRPDAPTCGIRCTQLLENLPNEGPKNPSGFTSLKKKSGNIGLQVSHEHQAGGGHASLGYASHVLNNSTKKAQRTYRKSNAVHANSKDATTLERNSTSSMSTQCEMNQKNSRPDYSVSNNKGMRRSQFSRAQSSPELTGTYPDALSQTKHDRFVETSTTHNEHVISERSSREVIDSETPSVQSARFSFDDPNSSRQSSSHQCLEVSTDSSIISNSYLNDSGSTTMTAGLASDSDAMELQQQKEQDLVNMMASSGNHNLIDKVQLPKPLASHLPFPFASVLTSTGYGQRNLTGYLGSGTQFLQSLGSSPLPYYCSNVTQNSNAEAVVPVNENYSKTSHEDAENNSSHSPDPGSTGSFETENERLQIHFDERQHSTASRYNHAPTRGNVSSASIMRGNLKVAAECREHRDDYPDAFPYQSGRTNVVSSTGRNANLRFVPTTEPSSCRRKSSLETSRDALNSRVTKTARDKWGRKPSLSEFATSLSGKPRCGQQFEGDSENASSWVDDESRDYSPPLSSADTYSEDHALEFVPLASSRVRNQPSRYEAAQISVADRSASIDPVVVGSSRQKVVDYSGAPPSSFYPEGPLVPSLTRFPAYNFLADGANSDGSINRFDEDSGEQNCKSPSHQDMDIVHKYNQFEGHMNSADLNVTRAAAAESEGLEMDILNSDFASHWQNLQYGRLCQNALNHGLFVYSPPVIGPPVYLQGHYPLDGSVGQTTANINFSTQIIGYDPWLVPVTSLQSGPSRPSSGYDRYKNERPRFRAGTGTYLPNPKSSFRDRNFSSKRNHRGNYNYGRSDKKDTEGSWISSKAQSGTPPTRLGRADDQRPANVNPQSRTHDQRHGANRGASALSSPEKPSSPHNKR